MANLQTTIIDGGITEQLATGSTWSGTSATMTLESGTFFQAYLAGLSADVTTFTINGTIPAGRAVSFILEIRTHYYGYGFNWANINQQTLSCTTQQYYGWMKPVPPLTTSTLSVGMTVTGTPFPSGTTITSIPNSETASGQVGATATGTYNLTFNPHTFKWPGGTPPTITQTYNQTDIYSFTSWDQGTTWYGSVVGQNFAPN